MFTVGLKGGMLRVASVAERVLLKLGGRAPDCGLGRACPALGGPFEHWRIMLARLIGGQCATASGPWRCACGPPVSAGPGSGVRPPHRAWSSSSSMCLHCVLCACLCQRIGSGGGGDQHGAEDPGTIAFGDGGGGQWRRSEGGGCRVLRFFGHTLGYAGYCMSTFLDLAVSTGSCDTHTLLAAGSVVWRWLGIGRERHFL